MALERIQELWGRLNSGVRAAMEPLAPILRDMGLDAPPLLVASAAVALLLIICIAILMVRRKPAARGQSNQYLAGEDFKQKRKVGRSIEKTLQELEGEDPQFVRLMRSILTGSDIDQLLSHEEIEVAFGRLSFLQEKRKNVPRKKSSLLALGETSPNSTEKRAAMLTVVRNCCLSPEIYSTMDESSRHLVDRFLDSL